MFGRGLLAVFLTVAMVGADGVILTAVALCDAPETETAQACGCKPEECPANQGQGITGQCCDVKAPAAPTSIPLARVKSSVAPITAPVVDQTDTPLPIRDIAPWLLEATQHPRIHGPPRYHLHCSYLI